MLLAIDTSNEYAGVALWDAHGLRGEANWHARRQHTEQVLPQVDLLMRHVGAAPGDIAAVAVATGPGSWSGLRAGMSLAKALAVGRGLPLIGVSTLDALAYGQRHRRIPVLAVVRLGRDRYGAARYVAAAAGWGRSSSFATGSATEVVELAHGALVIGDIPPGFDQQSEAGMTIAESSERQRRAVYAAQLGWERHIRGDHDDLVALEPIYLDSPVRE